MYVIVEEEEEEGRIERWSDRKWSRMAMFVLSVKCPGCCDSSYYPNNITNIINNAHSTDNTHEMISTI